MFRTRETRLAQGALCTPGAAVSTRPVILPAAACRLSTASPCRPGLQPAPGRIIDEASARVHCHSPHTSLPLTCDPGRNGILGLFPELRTRPGRTQQRTSGRGQARTLPGLRPWHQPASFDVLTHNVRPHVARIRCSACAGSCSQRSGDAIGMMIRWCCGPGWTSTTPVAVSNEGAGGGGQHRDPCGAAVSLRHYARRRVQLKLQS